LVADITAMTHGGVKNMRVSFTWRLGTFAAAVLSTIAFTTAAASAWWHPPTPTLYVNGSTLSGYGYDPCSTAAYTTISAAVAAAVPGSHIVVCPGTYDEGVQIDKPLVLSGIDAVIDAASATFGNGVQIVGPGGSGSTVEGFKIEQAEFEGILVGTAPVLPSSTDGAPVTEGSPVSHVTIAHDVLVDNGTGFGTGAGQCFSTPEAPGDCGETIHLVSVSDSIVEGNYVADNVGGILMTDEFGPTSHDLVRYNQSLNNTDDCGITLAGHSPAAVNPVTGLPTGAAGVFDNLIEYNVSSGNGVAGQGAGVLLGGGAPFAGVYGNVIRGNVAKGNGLSGVTIHQHLVGDLNVIEGNLLVDDNLDGDFDFATHATETTGVLVAAGAPPGAVLPPELLPGNISGTVIRGNRFYDVKVGIWTLGIEKASTKIYGNVFGSGVTPISEN
jgi:nitrous oxidase accessory protein NosD